MIIKSLILNNFKKYTDAKFEFKPGFNFIFGSNEAGKSTMHQAITAALYGIGAAKDGLNTKTELVRIGSDLPPIVGLEFSAAGADYKIVRNLQDAKVTLYEKQEAEFTKTNEDTKKVTQKITDFMGLDSAFVFNKTASIKQLDTASISNLEDLGKNIGAVVSGSGQASIEELEARLLTIRKRLKKERNEKPGELDLAEAKISDYKSKIEQADSLKQSMANRSQEATKIAERLPKAQQELAEINVLIAKQEKKQQVEDSKKQAQEKVEILLGSQNQLSAVDERLEKVQTEISALPNVGFMREHRELITNPAEPKTVRSKSKQASALVLGIAGLACLPLALMFNLFFLIPLALFLAVAAYLFINSKTLQAQTHGLTAEQFNQAALNLPKLQALEQELKSLQDLKVTIGKGSIEKENQLKKLQSDLVALHGLLLEYKDFNPDTQEVEKWHSQGRYLTQEIEQLKIAGGRIQGSQETLNRSFDPWLIEQELSALQETFKQKQFLLQAVTEALLVLQETKTEFEFNYLPVFTEHAQKYFNAITSNPELSIDLKAWPAVRVSNGAGVLTQTSLSAGTLDQLYLSLRLAAADLLSKNTNIPILLDDPFVTYDTARLTQTLNILKEIALTRQVVLFTHDKETKELLLSNATSTNINMVEL